MQRAPNAGLGLVVTLGLVAGQYAAYTFITPFLAKADHAGPRVVSVLLLVFGIGGLIGNFGVVRLLSRRLKATVMGMAATLAVATAAIPVIGAWRPAAVVALGVWGCSRRWPCSDSDCSPARRHPAARPVVPQPRGCQRRPGDPDREADLSRSLRHRARDQPGAGGTAARSGQRRSSNAPAVQLRGLFSDDGVPLHNYASYLGVADLAAAAVRAGRRTEGRDVIERALGPLHGRASPRLEQLVARARGIFADPSTAEAGFPFTAHGQLAPLQVLSQARGRRPPPAARRDRPPRHVSRSTRRRRKRASALDVAFNQSRRRRPGAVFCRRARMRFCRPAPMPHAGRER